ncbi:MAG TPA: group III truncated hemoglobin [Adhaeribacter sp.]|nr:group III truncated hemoglobin [Adhaeribacter sp.]
MNNQKTDIRNEADVKRLVDTFYDLVNQDELLSPVFNGHAHVDWETHLPIMYKFWGSLLLGTANYFGQPFPKHVFLPVDKTHFERWIELFLKNVDAQFEGEVAEAAKARGLNMARVFQLKMGLIPRGDSPFYLVEK